MTLTNFDMHVLQALSEMTEAVGALDIVNHMGYKSPSPALDVFAALECLKDHEVVREPLLWRYEITTAGREALDALKGDGEVDPLQLVYRSVG